MESVALQNLHLLPDDSRIRGGNGVPCLRFGRGWCCNGDQAGGTDSAVDRDWRGRACRRYSGDSYRFISWSSVEEAID